MRTRVDLLCVLPLTVIALAVALAAGCGDDSSAGPDANTCGNGEIDPGEECDRDGDGCTETCRLTCGDGVVGADEQCDTAIPAGEPGACPTDCNDEIACTADELVGTDCQAHCENRVIEDFIDDDGCCPDVAEAIAYNDLDCAPVCGNGLVEMGETCDTGIAAGEVGACPMMSGDCDDGIACTDDGVDIPDGEDGACQATCTHTVRTTVMDGDGCCPPDADYTTDDDCVGDRDQNTSTCGDGVLDGGNGETCDTAIAAGEPGACPTECTSGDACVEPLLLSSGTCKAVCHDVEIDHPANGDGCCPVFHGANNRNDDDCTTSCGTPAEECDTPGEGDCDTDCRIVRTAFRITELTLVDPHIYLENNGVCGDLTDIANDTSFPDAITGDEDGDGWADLTILSVMKPLDQAGASTPMDIVFGNCLPSADPADTECEADPLTDRIETIANNMDSSTCLDTVAGTLTASYDAPATPAGPCFVSESFTGDLQLGSLTVPMQNAYMAATYVGDPADGLVTGLIRGFVSEADAMTATIPDTVILIGGKSLYEVLAGGIDPSCPQDGEPIGDDRDTGPDDQTSGWYFYVNFTAEEVPFDDKPVASQ